MKNGKEEANQVTKRAGVRATASQANLPILHVLLSRLTFSHYFSFSFTKKEKTLLIGKKNVTFIYQLFLGAQQIIPRPSI